MIIGGELANVSSFSLLIASNQSVRCWHVRLLTALARLRAFRST